MKHDAGTAAGYGPGSRDGEHFYMQWTQVGTLDQAPLDVWSAAAMNYAYPGQGLESNNFSGSGSSQTVYGGIPGFPLSYQVGAGQIWQSVGEGGSMTNTTLANHVLCCGQVTRSVLTVGNNVYVLTMGVSGKRPAKSS